MNRKGLTLIEVLIVLAVIVIIIVGFSKVFMTNTQVRAWGGTMTIDLVNKKLVNVTWKESDLWILSRKAKPGDTKDTYYFEEKSTMGVLQGTIIINER